MRDLKVDYKFNDRKGSKRAVLIQLKQQPIIIDVESCAIIINYLIPPWLHFVRLTTCDEIANKLSNSLTVINQYTISPSIEQNSPHFASISCFTRGTLRLDWDPGGKCSPEVVPSDVLPLGVEEGSRKEEVGLVGPHRLRKIAKTSKRKRNCRDLNW